jgi:hypothetical protein
MRSEFSISAKAKNLFLSLVESITQTLNVTLCYVYGGTNMGDHWPWEARELDPQESFNDTAFPKHRKDVWLLKNFHDWKLLYLLPRKPILHPCGSVSPTNGGDF